MMTFEEFKETIDDSIPPKKISQNLLALWSDATGDWHKAHDIVQKTSGNDGDWIHAYLHRKEGDLSNASYWYSRIGKSRPNTSLNQEWEELVRHLIEKKN
jgi:hypothetical protein